MATNKSGHRSDYFTRYVRWSLRLAWDSVTTIFPAIIFALFINVYVAQAVSIEEGPSMEPNLYVGYRVMTEKITYRLHFPERGDIVVVESCCEDLKLIKRVVALPGEVVEVRNGHTFIDGQPIDEPWVTNFGGTGYRAQQIPPEHIFILGDNRTVSHDSRAFGPVPVSAVLGRAWLVYWPFDQFAWLP